MSLITVISQENIGNVILLVFEILFYRLNKAKCIILISIIIIIILIIIRINFYPRGPAHSSPCNINLRIRAQSIQIPCWFHNLKGYDAHLIMQSVKSRHGQVTCIPNNQEKFISFSVGGITFKDSLAFLQTSLDELVSNLPLTKMINTRKFLELSVFKQKLSVDKLILPKKISETNEESSTNNFTFIKGKTRWYDYKKSPFIAPSLSEEQKTEVNTLFELVTRKGVYCYEYMSSFDRFEEKKLPPIKKFHSTLSGVDISVADYKHAEEVWKKFNLKNLGEYHDLYVLIDILQLSDVLAEFREMCYNNYKIDPFHCYTIPGLTWQAGLRFCGIEIDLVTDKEMFLFIEGGKRGGISKIVQRHAIREESHECSKKTELIYLDANNLYGAAMSEYLPTGGLQWEDESTCAEWNNNLKNATRYFLSIDKKAEFGCWLEVDWEYPQYLHDEHNEYPFLPEKLSITYDMLSPFQQNLLKKFNLLKTPDTYCSAEKLVPNLNDKKKYILHYRNLQQCIQKGLKITKIHRVLWFKQSDWLKAYIDYNTKRRAQAKNEFEKNFFKLMNNSMFGMYTHILLNKYIKLN